ncbi:MULTISPECIES: MerR family transcriptional regulator [Aeromonas]|uniref:hypothetical protein n=1 Tax=Aeromonas TaxID=642 RepID=UPI000694A9B2|nr:hypothetical protein [Aeromonas caviae]MBS4636048.1 hypothetical protein [Aeromonas caviae]WQD90395.1 hypothetical protein U0022_06745 [Aeromonas caviae]SQH58908.1 MerR family transcriptional regulator [Aeromonas caviae]
MNPIGAQGQECAHNKQQWQTLIRLLASAPGEMPCERNAAQATTSVKPAIVLRGARRHKQEEKQG